jgi:hypothetical protein
LGETPDHASLLPERESQDAVRRTPRLLFLRRLGRFLVTFSLSLSPVLAFGPDPQPAEDPEAVLQHIRSKVAEDLSHLPNYTCHEVISRLFRPLNSSSLGHQDQVEVEVAFLGGRELFARPGDSRFQEQSITQLVSSGTISSGVFGSHAGSIFRGNAASFRYVGVSEKDGHAAYRYDFQVPQEKSSFVVKHDSAEGMVAYHGSFWADVGTLDLVHIEIKADDIPRHIGVRFIAEKIRYMLMRIGDAEFLLPRHAELEASDSLGNYSLNEQNLERCREFTGQSTVTFNEPSDHVSSADSQ